MTWLDLSVPLRTGMPIYPGDPEVRIEPALTVGADGANVLSLAIGTHSGTHADAPLHVNDSWASLTDLPLSLYSGTAELVDVRDVGRGHPITAAHLAGIAPAGHGEHGNGNPERLLLLRTGFADAWGTDEYLRHPWLDAAAAQLIVDRGYRTVGLDALSVDPSPHGGPDASATGHGFPAHDILAGNGCVIVENLTGLGLVQSTLDSGSGVEVFLFPLNIPGADGAPIRAVARPLPEQPAPGRPGARNGEAVCGRELGRAEIQEAADRLVAAFGACDTEAYFESFSPDATFIFHPEEKNPASRAEYRSLWEDWLESGWRVLECRSSEQNIQLLGTTAIFSHRVATTVQTDRAGGRQESDERETIVFHRGQDGSVRCVHEHLSLFPG
ncbi:MULTISPECIES: cyclase family protein [unclassified Arthrobacter]|uniref:cyclase family protein n=1 Tax=unclassified Arthrobacter TaxID=235627 RepID=UPI002DFA3E17|nr:MULTISPECIES: cyclase family protein [unclassified Arthrobacter]MEC5189797.1 kynurenine formamidase/ketosteroid isomerase-like protein [Arthrobacter sp. MP_M4]MEC5201264.1 kynurenine formamidase/ketosteroid isomerase-like protein [Arthrobacter sp. MP_M7]